MGGAVSASRVRKTDSDPPFAVAGAFSYGLLAARLLAVSVHGWMLGKHFDTPRNDYAPRTISESKGFNYTSDRMLREIEGMNLDNALVLVRPCSNWQCYGTVFWKNDPNFDGDVVFARDLPEMRANARAISRPADLPGGLRLAQASCRTIHSAA